MTLTEHDVQSLALDYLNRQPDVFAWRQQSTGIYDPVKKVWRKKQGFDIVGVSDIMAIVFPHGHTLAIEVKEPGSTQSALSVGQKAFLKKIESKGGTAVWVQSLDEVVDALARARSRRD